MSTTASVQQARAGMYRTLILPAAEHLFAINGVDQVKMQQIAAAAGLSLATVYNTFSGKEEIISTIHETHMRNLLAHCQAAVDSNARAAANLITGAT